MHNICSPNIKRDTLLMQYFLNGVDIPNISAIVQIKTVTQSNGLFSASDKKNTSISTSKNDVHSPHCP